MDLQNTETNEKVSSSTSPDKIAVSSNKKPFWRINRETLRITLHYFLFEGALGAALPFVSVFAKNEIGISATSLGVVLTVQQFIFIITKPVIGYLVDYFNKLKLVITCLMFGQGIFLFLILPIQKIQLDESQNVVLNASHYETAYYELNVCKLCDKCGEFQYTPSSLLSSEGLHCSQNFCSPKEKNVTTVESMEQWCNGSNADVNDLHAMQNPNSFPNCIMCFNDIQNETIFRTSLKNNTEKGHYGTSSQNDFKTYQFWVFSLLYMISAICTNSLFTLVDTACCESVQRTGADFGRLRLWGAIGWGVMAPIGGCLNDYTNNYLASWCVMAILSILTVWNISKLDLVKPQFSQNILQDVGTVLKSKEFLCFELGVLMNGIGTGIIWFYLIWFLSTIGGSRLLFGLTQTIQCFIGEIPFMFYSGWMIKKVGHFPLLSMALLAYSARFFWYSYLHNPWYVLPIEVLHGFTYGIFYPNVALYGKLSAKPGTEATTLSILFTTHEGLGAGLGCILAGVGFDYLGTHKTFFIISMCTACGMIINIFFTLLLQTRKRVLTIETKDDA